MRGRGPVRVPGDKSISHRALIVASLAEGTSRITGILQSADVHSTASVMRALGARIPELASDFAVRGGGLRGLTAPSLPLDCGNSGTTARLVAGIAAAYPFSTRFVGDESLSRRPMRRVAEPLTAMGASFEFAWDDGLPMTVRGGELRPVEWHTRTASAQVKSAILLASLAGGVTAVVSEARRSRDHTERMLRAAGVSVEVDGLTVRTYPVGAIAPLELAVPGDPSSAAYPVALHTVSGEGELVIERVCINPTRTGFYDVLRRMGACIEFENQESIAGEEVAAIRVRRSELVGSNVRHDEVPRMIDELPLLGAVAAAAGVNIEVTEATELRVKESDRIRSIVTNLAAVGASAEELPDGFRVHARDAAPLSGRVRTHGDHRIAMAFGILGSIAGNTIDIDDRECVSVSFPGFWEALAGWS